MKREELLSNKGYWLAKLQMELYDELRNYMKSNGLNQTQLAQKLGVSKGYISQIINGEFNHRLSTLVDLSLSMGKAPKLSFTDLDQLTENKSVGKQRVQWAKSKKQKAI